MKEKGREEWIDESMGGIYIYIYIYMTRRELDMTATGLTGNGSSGGSRSRKRGRRSTVGNSLTQKANRQSGGDRGHGAGPGEADGASAGRQGAQDISDEL